MAATIKIVDPVTRLEGHLKIEVSVDLVGGVQQVVDAKATGNLFRGLETIMINRHPADSQHITARICGVCPVPHSMAAIMALDQAFGATVPDNARIMRNLVLGANLIDSHILHFYHLMLLDYIDGPAMPPWTPVWAVDRRIPSGTVDTLVGHYVTALDMRRKAHEMGALFGGKLPCPPTYVPGGFTCQPNANRITTFGNYLTELITFINGTLIPDAQLVASYYPDYYQIGRGPANLLSFGVFDLDASGSSKLLSRGRVVNGSTTVQTVDVNAITEQVTYSWYADSTNNLNPAVGATTPVDPATKPTAYTWLKAPRYSSAPYEAGPLSRMWVNGDYRNGISAMDRHMARAQEALKVAQAMQTWLNQIVIGDPVYNYRPVPTNASGIGLTEAPRGALGHWLSISNKGKISRYQVVTPTCWNASPKDTAGVKGPIESALIGTPVTDINLPVEVLRVIHSFDPCIACAVHVMRPGADKKVFTLPHYHGEDGSHDHGDGHDHSHHGHDH